MLEFESEDNQQNLWPTAVDVMSNMFIIMLFLVIIFLITNFISVAVAPTGNRQVDNRIAELERQVSEKERLNATLVQHIRAVKSDTDAVIEAGRDKIKLEASSARIADLNAMVFSMEEEIIKKDNQIRDTEAAAKTMEEQVVKLTREMQKLNDVFETTDKYIKWQKVQIVELGKQLNRALANKTAELHKVRSDFFGSLLKPLSNNKNFEIAGDRFSMPSEVFFKVGSAEIGPEGEIELAKIAEALVGAMQHFPADTEWILRVDGHTDNTPMRAGSAFANNWELSQARALSVVRFLIDMGIPANRLAPAGFGEFHPVDPSNPAANRRIEFKLTER